MLLTTKQKIALARTACDCLRFSRRCFGRGMQGRFRRAGCRWALDLNQGIDFSIYLLGSFEPNLLRFYTKLISPGSVVMDIGANIGAHTLPLGKLVGPAGRVYAIEATEYAVGRLRENLSLNPDFAKNVQVFHTLLNEGVESENDQAIPSSWPLQDEPGLHEQHGGKFNAVGKATRITLDDFVMRENISRLDWIKLDVDGNEWRVLSGGERTLSRFHPKILMELAPSYHDPAANDLFSKLVKLLFSHGYVFETTPARKALPMDANNLRAVIPEGASINVLATAGP